MSRSGRQIEIFLIAFASLLFQVVLGMALGLYALALASLLRLQRPA